MFSDVFWRGINTQTNPEHHYSPQHHIKGPNLSKSNKTQHYFCLIKPSTRCISCIVNFGKHNECRTFHNVCALHVRLRPRLFVLLRMSCLRRQSRHETRKGDVVPVLCWAANEEQIPVDTTFSVNCVCSDYVTGGSGTTEDIYSKHRSTETFVVKLFGANPFTKHTQQPLHLVAPSGLDPNWFPLLSLLIRVDPQTHYLENTPVPAPEIGLQQQACLHTLKCQSTTSMFSTSDKCNALFFCLALRHHLSIKE